MNQIEVVKGGNFGDSYYWDYRMWFRYNGKEYTYLGVGSFSGYVPCSDHIGRGFVTMLNGRSLDMDERDWWNLPSVDVHEDLIIDLVEKLEASGEDTLDIEEK